MESLYNKLANEIYKYCGLDFTKNIELLETKLRRHQKMIGCHFSEIYIKLVMENKDEWEKMIELLTINETYFYREEKQLKAFSDFIIPELERSYKVIKVWSAACSSGEEPYSLIMNSLDKQYFKLEQLQILATDINKEVLETATNGKYFKKSLSFRRIPLNWLENYFNEDEQNYYIKKEIKERITFEQLNLLNFSHYPEEGTLDVIFCRNVLIYFDDLTILNILNGFYKSLKKGGYLFLGHSEMITKYNLPFTILNNNGTFYYRKD